MDPSPHKPPKRGVIGRAAVATVKAPVLAYRLLISPLLGPHCRYEPTCSAYMIDAIEIHGPLKGLYLGTRRILRCHPIRWLGGGSGHDPVPPRKR
jgi:putative membrane protein insertion efficiency factor